tara:strand:+ start:1491 stop:1982 length:492 start_codon:yes stop_codon:yes gene_type:complete
MHITIKNNYLTYKEYKIKCAVGKRGIKIKKREGDLITPKGSFRIRGVFYRKDKIKTLKTRIKIKPIKKNMGWCDDPKSEKYNKLIKYPFNHNSEKLYRTDNIYDIIVVLNFNMNPIKKNKGSAIFIHVAKKKFSPTKGCVAIKKNELKKLLENISHKSIIKII